MTPTPSQDIISLLCQRFVQREDCYPLQIAGNGGGYTVIREPITDVVIADHLQGSKTIGLYSSPDSTTKWLCIDIDTLDESELRKIQARVSQLGIPFLTECSGDSAWVGFVKEYPDAVAFFCRTGEIGRRKGLTMQWKETVESIARELGESKSLVRYAARDRKQPFTWTVGSLYCCRKELSAFSDP